MIEYAKDPIVINDHQIELTVKFSHIPEEVRFTADSFDSEPHGRELYQRALNEEFGVIDDD